MRRAGAGRRRRWPIRQCPSACGCVERGERGERGYDEGVGEGRDGEQEEDREKNNEPKLKIKK
jgi:hypothetical protein